MELNNKMLKKEDFKNPIDWVIYQVNGKKNNTTNNRINENYTLSEAKYPLKFYKTRSEGRYSVIYGKNHLCNCSYENARKVQDYFDEHFNGKNLNHVTSELKKKHNQIIKTRKRGRKPKSYKRNHLRFQPRKNGRLEVAVSDKGKTHTLCSCNPNQKEQVSSRYDELKTEHDLDYIKKTMKEEFNLRVNGRVNGKYNSNDNVKHQISIREDGVVFKDGQYVCVNEQLYDIVSMLL